MSEKIDLGAQGFVYPMPVTLIGSDLGDAPTFMTVAWVNRVQHNPPRIAIGINKQHATNQGIREHGEFSVCFPANRMSTGTQRDEYSPGTINSFNVQSENRTQGSFKFQNGESSLSLLYSPSDPIRVDHPGVTFAQPGQPNNDIVAWHAFPWVKAGETYEVEALLKNPDQQQLREAGTDYPDWVKKKYLQLPANFSPQIKQLAQDLTFGAETPYDQAAAITDYLRSSEYQYSTTVDNPPRNRDRLEWFLFDNKKGFCVYFASRRGCHVALGSVAGGDHRILGRLPSTQCRLAGGI